MTRASATPKKAAGLDQSDSAPPCGAHCFGDCGWDPSDLADPCNVTSATGIGGGLPESHCPGCGIVKFIGHGPLCSDCYLATEATS